MCPFEEFKIFLIYKNLNTDGNNGFFAFFKTNVSYNLYCEIVLIFPTINHLFIDTFPNTAQSPRYTDTDTTITF